MSEVELPKLAPPGSKGKTTPKATTPTTTTQTGSLIDLGSASTTADNPFAEAGDAGIGGGDVDNPFAGMSSTSVGTPTSAADATELELMDFGVSGPDPLGSLGGGGGVGGGGGGGSNPFDSSDDEGNAQVRLLMEEDDVVSSPSGGGGGGGGVRERTGNGTEYAPYQIKYYAPYFDVSTWAVLKRMSLVFFPVKRVEADGDLYGAFWIPATLVFVMAVTTNVASYLAANAAGNESEWTYDFHKIVMALALVFGYVGVFPLLVGGVANWYDIPLSFVHTFSLYGYSLVPLIPTSMACILPSEPLRWLLVSIAFLISSAFLLRNIYPPFTSVPFAPIPVLIAIVVAHATLCLVLKLYFFEYSGSAQLS